MLLVSIIITIYSGGSSNGDEEFDIDELDSEGFGDLNFDNEDFR